MKPSTREKLCEYSIGAKQQSYYDVVIVADEYESDEPYFNLLLKMVHIKMVLQTVLI